MYKFVKKVCTQEGLTHQFMAQKHNLDESHALQHEDLYIIYWTPALILKNSRYGQINGNFAIFNDMENDWNG